MKVLQIIPNRGWCLDKLFKLIVPTEDIIIDRFYMTEKNIPSSDYDVLHFHFWANLPEVKISPSIVTIQHIEKKDEKTVIGKLKKYKPDIVISANKHSQDILGSYGIKSELILNTTARKPVRVGYLGLSTNAELHYKNYNIIDEACEALGLECDGQRRNGVELKMTEDELEEWYRSLNVFVTANSLPGSMPALEALACGTPVIATEIAIKPQEWGVTYFDGTTADLIEKLKLFIPKFSNTPEEYSRRHLELYKDAERKFYEN